MNYFETNSKLYSVVDAPGYGNRGVSGHRAKKLANLVKKYANESSRLCKIFWLVDINKGLQDPDFEFISEMAERRIAMELVFTKADVFKHTEELMYRAFGLSHEVKRFNRFISPICHLTSAK